VVPLLVVRRRGELRDPDVPRVERSDQPLDDAALARGVPPLEQHAQRRAQALLRDLTTQQQAQLQQPQPCLLEALLGVNLVQPRGQVDLC